MTTKPNRSLAFDLSLFTSKDRKHRRLLKEITPGHYELCVDNTTLEKMLMCPRSLEVYAVLGRDSGERDALNYGAAIHRALDVYYRGGALDDMIIELRQAFTEKPCGADSWRNFDHALASIEQYVRWRDQMVMCPWEPILLGDKPAVEIPFKLELFTVVDVCINYPPDLVAERLPCALPVEMTGFYCKSITVYYTGKIDLLIKARMGGVAVLDHKTTSIGGETFWGQFRLSAQMRGYCWAAGKLIGQPVRQLVIDAIMGRPYTTKGKGVPHENEMREFDYSDAQIASWEQDTIEHCDLLIKRLSKGYFPEANQWCFNKFGECPYFAACHMSKRAGSQLLASGQYAERVWDPLTS